MKCSQTNPLDWKQAWRM